MTINKIFTTAIIGLAITFGLMSCGKLASLINKTLNITTPGQNFTIPPVPYNSTLSVNFLPSLNGSFEYNLDSFIKANTDGALGINNITFLRIDSCTFTVTNPTATSNFQAFDTASIAFTSSSNSTPYVLKASQPNVYSVNLTMRPADTTINMQSYIQGNTFKYTISGKMRSATTDSMKCTGAMSFTVRIKG